MPSKFRLPELYPLSSGKSSKSPLTSGLFHAVKVDRNYDFQASQCISVWELAFPGLSVATYRKCLQSLSQLDRYDR